MNETTLRERAKKLLEINKTIKKLDETIRSAAFSLLKDYVLGSAAAGAEKQHDQHTPEGDIREDSASFFSNFNHKKPSDNALLVSAYYYNQYGSSPFAIDQIKKIANEVGLTIPGRLDMTFIGANAAAKAFFFAPGKANFVRPFTEKRFSKIPIRFLKAENNIHKMKQKLNELPLFWRAILSGCAMWLQHSVATKGGRLIPIRDIKI